jgi:hypothetical protein
MLMSVREPETIPTKCAAVSIFRIGLVVDVVFTRPQKKMKVLGVEYE